MMSVDGSGSLQHPYGVQPLGNAMCVTSNTGTHRGRMSGLGSFRVLEDQLMVVLLQFLDAASLVHLSSASSASYVFCHHVDLWRALVLQSFDGEHCWDLSWKQSFVTSTLKKRGVGVSTRSRGPCPLSPGVHYNVITEIISMLWPHLSLGVACVNIFECRCSSP